MRVEDMTGTFGSSFSSHRWEPDAGIIFSSLDGFVWASWPENEAAVRLGRHGMVTDMMRDFLAQDDLGQRLATRRSADD
jgi:hypothetical protein